MEALEANVILARARARVSQIQLAERSGVSRATISKIETGAAADVNVGTLEQLARALGCTVADFFVAASDDNVDDNELARRAAAPDDEFVDAETLLAAVDEAAGHDPARYSRAGRPRMAR
ncbi:MAG: helix-turn-helix domain-containing protein [Candidatus Eremiobacteraeota bacterium]|nr:helix-turn-helix domain-containing protein [Candidatus Eremiobacteraeota bacterium]